MKEDQPDETPTSHTPRARGFRNKHLPPGLYILHEDPHLLVIDKPPGLLTMGTEKEQERTAYFAMTAYVRRGAPKSPKRIFIVHRLDREASGVVVFAKTEPVKRALQEGWDAVEKTYLAGVHGHPREAQGVITSYLMENKALFVRSTSNREEGKLSRTEYRVLQQTQAYSLLEVRLLTGRKHQIRVHLAEQGWPIIGDARYGRKDGQKQLALHALRLAFTHPHTGKPVQFETAVPAYFRRLMGG